MTARRFARLYLRLVCLSLLASLSACLATQPRNTDNLCIMFEERRSWYKAADRAEKRWGVPAYVSMAFINQESSYRARAKPPRGKFLWIFPGARPSSAFGYAQALDSTWGDYEADTGNGWARRSNFADAIDFIGWYNHNSYRRNNIARDDVRNLYLAYHEGHAGFARGSYHDKPWLIETANRVQQKSDRYQSQYAVCQSELSKNWFFRLFS